MLTVTDEFLWLIKAGREVPDALTLTLLFGWYLGWGEGWAAASPSRLKRLLEADRVN